MEQTPSGPLSRAASLALETAGRRLVHAREGAVAERRIETELERARAQADSAARQLASERSSLKGENERTRNEHMRMVEETEQRLAEERKAHKAAMESERSRLLESERNAGRLEGQVNALSSEALMLRQQVVELQQMVRDVEHQKGQHLHEQEQLRRDLQEERAMNSKLRLEAANLQQTFEEEVQKLQQAGMKPKCGPKGCYVQ